MATKGNNTKKLLIELHYPHDNVLYAGRKTPNASCELHNPYTIVATLIYIETMELETSTREPSWLQ